MMDSAPEIIGPINIGNSEEFTIKELADIVLSLTNSDAKVVYKDLPVDDPVKRRPDIVLAKEFLGWSSFIQLKDGLDRTISHFGKFITKEKH